MCRDLVLNGVTLAFSYAKSLGGRCRGCGQRGHLLAWCLEVVRRVSLSGPRVSLLPRHEVQQSQPKSGPAAAYVDSVTPDDARVVPPTAEQLVT